MDLPIRAWAHHIADRRLQRVTDCSVPVNSKGKRRAARADPGTRRSIAAGPLPFVASSTVTATPCNTGDKDFATPGSAQPRPVGYQDRTRKRALRSRLNAPGGFGPLLRAEVAAHARLDAHRPAHIRAAVSGTATSRKTRSEPCRGWHILFRRPTGTPTWRWRRRWGVRVSFSHRREAWRQTQTNKGAFPRFVRWRRERARHRYTKNLGARDGAATRQAPRSAGL